MILSRYILCLLFTTTFCVVGAWARSFETGNPEQIALAQEQIKSLQRENARLKESLVASNLREEECATTLAKIKTRMGALGKSILFEEDNRLISALAEIESLQNRLNTIETAGVHLIDTYRQFLSTVLVANPDNRTEVEQSLRSLELAIGLRDKPARLVDAGSLHQAKIISIDQESGLVVLNVGDHSDVRIGMRFNITRGTLQVAEGIVAEVRDNVSGLLVQTLHHSDLSIQLGDTAKVITSTH